jgi:hypothetical protein
MLATEPILVWQRREKSFIWSESNRCIITLGLELIVTIKLVSYWGWFGEINDFRQSRGLDIGACPYQLSKSMGEIPSWDVIVAQIVKKFPTFYETRRFIILSTRILLSWTHISVCHHNAKGRCSKTCLRYGYAIPLPACPYSHVLKFRSCVRCSLSLAVSRLRSL